MTDLLSLPAEILQLIFRALQAITRGPRYCLTPVSQEADKRPEQYARWRLIDPGPLNLASTCRALQDVYLLRTTAGNLILSLPPSFVPDSKGSYVGTAWMEPYIDSTLEYHLRRLKATRKSSPISRFVLDSEWEAFDYSIRPLCEKIWSEILTTVSEVFGNELAIVILSQGRDVLSERRELAPIKMKNLERLEIPGDFYTPKVDLPEDPVSTCPSTIETLPSVSSRTRTISLRSGRNPAPPLPSYRPKPSTEQLQLSAPLSLHIYFGWQQYHAEALWSEALAAFSNNNLRSLYISSDPNNLHLVGHPRRRGQGRESYTVLNTIGNPWRHLLPHLTAASDTLEAITLDCSLFWSEFAYALCYLHKVQKLDLELALIHSEPMYPYELLSKAQAKSTIIETCFNPNTMAKEKAKKKNKTRKWLDITRDKILFPAVEPINIKMPDDPHSRHATVFETVCDQLQEIRLEKSSRN